MPSSIPFTGAAFSLQSVTATGPAKLRVRFTQIPLQVSPTFVNDGLRPQNYTLTGPGNSAAASVSVVGADPNSLDLNLTIPLARGTWQLTAANVQTPTGSSLTPPVSMTVVVTALANITELTAGATTDDANDIIRKHLSPALAGPTWDALIEALSLGDQMNWDNAQAAFDQMFETSASGKYLDRLASNDGLTRPAGVGISDDIFRKLVIQLTASKITHEALRQILEIFYGRDSVRAYAETQVSEPFALQVGQTLTWTLDEEEPFQYTVVGSDYAVAGNAKAIEVSAALTKAMTDQGGTGIAAAVVTSDGTTRVRIYSGSLGLRSAVRVTGGTAQPSLQFPTLRSTYGGTVTTGLGYNWVFTRPSSATTRMTLITTGQPIIDISTVEVGDYLVVGPGIAVPAGSYPVTLVEFSWSGGNLTQIVELGMDLGFVGTYLQAANSNFTWFQPTHRTSSSGSRSVVVAQTRPGIIDVQLPATTQAVDRGARLAAYGRVNAPIAVQQYYRDSTGLLTIIPSPSFLTPPPAGSRLLMDGFNPGRTRPWVSLGTPGTYPSVGLADASYGTTWSATQVAPSQLLEQTSGCLLNNGDFLVAGGLVNPANTADAHANRFRLVGTQTVTDGSEAAGATRRTYQWITTASMNTARWRHRVCTLIDGRVLATGGMTAALAHLQSSELYDPSGNAWANQPNMSAARAHHIQVRVPDGRVLVAGGSTAAGPANALLTAETFNPATLAWTSVASMAVRRQGARAVLLNDGTVMVTGGCTVFPYLVGNTTNSVEIWDPVANIWYQVSPMNYTRCYHQIVLLSDGRVMVFGGRGYQPDKPAPTGSDGLLTSEFWDPKTKVWTPGPMTQQAWIEATTAIMGGTRLVVAGGSGGFPGFIETLSLTRFVWQVHFLAETAHRDRIWDLGTGIALLTGGNNAGTTYTTADMLIPGANTYGGGGLNGVAEVKTPGTATITVSMPAHTAYATNTGDPKLPGGTSFNPATQSYVPDANYTYSLQTAQRTTNVTTLTLNGSLTTAGLSVGQQIYVNLNVLGYTPGWQTITATTTTTVSYADPGANAGPTTLTGAITLNRNPNATITLAAAQPQPTTDPGPYIFDADEGVAITAVQTTLTTGLLLGQQSDRLQVASAANFPDAPGFVVLSFGTGQQSVAVKYLEKIGTTTLLLDFGYRAEHDYPVGTTVDLLSQRGPFVPANPLDSANFYLTGSQSGRVAAQSLTTDAAAAGVEVDFTVVYPGDRGLGGEGFPTEGTGKLSDIVEVFGADEGGA